MNNLNSLEIQEELQIKNSKSISVVTSLSYLIFIIVCIFFLNLLLKNQPESLTTFAIMPIGTILFSLIMIFLEIRKMNSIVIQINKKGIQTYKRALMNWDDIENEKIISRTFTAKESKHDFKNEINYLFFNFRDERIEIKIDDLDITDSELNHYLKIYRESFNQRQQNISNYKVH
ncbi:hypothetical protein [Chryseobacterium sp.]|uniref:hypothetical protein n=1 Tax=Chryseobacterium sp. TaxID=1871047 RepID=UPI0026025D45|nr:hypothetical protein [Chryseobacterium sp.]